MYKSTPAKPDESFNPKFYYLCQTRGCGAIINTAFPVSEKNPSPKWCKDCTSKEIRNEIEQEYDKHDTSRTSS